MGRVLRRADSRTVESRGSLLREVPGRARRSGASRAPSPFRPTGPDPTPPAFSRPSLAGLGLYLVLAAVACGGCSVSNEGTLSVQLTYPRSGAASSSVIPASPAGARAIAATDAGVPLAYAKLPANRILIRVLAPHIPVPLEAWFDRAAGRGEVRGIPPGDRIVVEVDEYDNTAVTVGTGAPLLGRGWAQGISLAPGESKTVTVPMYDKGTIVRVCGAPPSAGAGTAGDAGDGGLAAGATLGQPLAVKVGPGDELFISSAQFNRVRKVDRYGYIAHYAGSGPPGTLANGQVAASAPIGAAYELDFGPSGDFYLITWDQQIIRIDRATGQIAIKYDAQKGIFNTAARPDLAVVDDNAIFYTNAMENRVYLVQGGVRTEYVIDNVLATDIEGALLTSTVIRTPAGVTYDPGTGGLVYCSKDTNRVKRIPLAVERVYTEVGSASPIPYFEGIARTDMAPQRPYLMEHDRFGGIREFFAEQDLNTVKFLKLDVDPGTVWTLAGNGTPGYSGDGGPATAAQLNDPRSVTTDSRGNVYIADTGNHAIRMVVGGALP